MSHTNELPSGLYSIHVSETKHLVGRWAIEDRSLLPKPVFTLGPDVKGQVRWQVEKTKDGLYILKNGGAPVGPWSRSTAERDQHLFAFLPAGPFDGSVEWKISPVHTTTGKTGYIIETKLTTGESIAWSGYGAEVAPGRVPVAVRVIPATASLPPQFLPIDVFEFVRIDRESADE